MWRSGDEQNDGSSPWHKSEPERFAMDTRDEYLQETLCWRGRNFCSCSSSAVTVWDGSLDVPRTRKRRDRSPFKHPCGRGHLNCWKAGGGAGKNQGTLNLNLNYLHQFLWFGYFQCVSTYSGHYRPTDVNLEKFLAFLKENKVDLNEIQVSNSYTCLSESSP